MCASNLFGQPFIEKWCSWWNWMYYINMARYLHIVYIIHIGIAVCEFGSICHFKRVHVISQFNSFILLLKIRLADCSLRSCCALPLYGSRFDRSLFYISLGDFWMFRFWVFNCVHDACPHIHTYIQQSHSLFNEFPFKFHSKFATFKLNRNCIQYCKRFHAEHSLNGTYIKYRSSSPLD